MKIKKIISEKEKKYGTEDGAIILDQAHHGCSPDMPHGWCAPAIRDNKNGTFDIGAIWWDFEELGDTDDAGDYPWEGTGEFFPESEGLTLEDDLQAILNWIE